MIPRQQVRERTGRRTVATSQEGALIIERGDGRSGDRIHASDNALAQAQQREELGLGPGSHYGSELVERIVESGTHALIVLEHVFDRYLSSRENVTTSLTLTQ